LFVLDLPFFGTQKIVTQQWGIPFMMQAWYSFCLCSALYIAISLLTPPPRPEQIEGLTWEHPLAVITQSRAMSISDPRLISLILLVTIAVLYYIFR
jgi:SSS family solute:Na+ symporter